MAAVSVLASHYGQNVASALGYVVTPVFHNLGTFGVQVFFAITGLLFTRKAVAARGQLVLAPFVAGRLRRIVPMYTCAIVLSVCVAGLARHPTNPLRLLREAWALYTFGFVLEGAPVISGVPYAEVIGTIWTLPFEWLFYLFVPVLAVVVRSWRSIAVAALVLGLYYGPRMADAPGDVFTPFFLPGVLAGLLPRAAVPPGRSLLLALTAGFIALCAVLPGTQDFTLVRLAAMTAFFVCVVSAAPPLLARTAPATLGDVSYSLYLLHFPALFVARAAFDAPSVALFAHLPRAAAFVGVAMLVVMLSAATFRLIERPFLRPAGAA